MPDNLTSKVMDIPMDKIDLNPLFQMRDVKTANVDSMAASIKELGLLNPLLCRPKGDRFELVNGWRRYLGLKKNKAEMVRATVREMTDEQAFVCAMTENIERENPSPLEEARAFKTAVDKLNMKAEDIAKQIQKSPSYVSNRMRLLEMDPIVQDALNEGKITPGHAEHGFMRLRNPADQRALLREVTQQADYGKTTTVADLDYRAKAISDKRKKADNLVAFKEKYAARIKTWKCPTCGKAPNPHYWQMKLDGKEPEVGCTAMGNHHWNPFKEAVKPKADKAKSVKKTLAQLIEEDGSPHDTGTVISHISPKVMADHLLSRTKKYDVVGVNLETAFDGEVSITVKFKVPKKDHVGPDIEVQQDGKEISVGFGWISDGYDEALKDYEALESAAAKTAKIKAAPFEWEPGDAVAELRVGGEIPRACIRKGHELPSGAIVKETYADWSLKVLEDGKTRIMGRMEVIKILEEEEKADIKEMAKGSKKGLEKKLVAGVCSECGCTEEKSCKTGLMGNTPCSWTDKERTLCTACAKKTGLTKTARTAKNAVPKKKARTTKEV